MNIDLQLCAGIQLHPKSEKIGGDYLSAQKNLRKKCVNLDDKKCNEFCDKIAYLLTKYDVCV